MEWSGQGPGAGRGHRKVHSRDIESGEESRVENGEESGMWRVEGKWAGENGEWIVESGEWS